MQAGDVCLNSYPQNLLAGENNYKPLILLTAVLRSILSQRLTVLP